MVQNRPATYSIESAKIQSETETEFVIGAFTPPWFTMLVRSGIFILLAVAVFVIGGKSTLLLGFVFFALALIFPYSLPLNIQISFNFLAGQITLTAFYLLRRPQHTELLVPFSQVAKLDFRFAKPINKRIVDVYLVDGTKFVLDFGLRKNEAQKLVDRFSSLAGSQVAPVLNSPEAVKVADVTGTQALMQRELRSWSIWLLVLGAGQMFVAQGFSSWGALLIGVGLASFYFRESAMFVVYAATIAWAGLSNLLSGTASAWNFFAFFQFYLAFVVFRQFQRFQKAEREVQPSSEAEPETISRAGKLFPWCSAIFGVGGLMGYALTWLAAIIFAVLKITTTENPLVWDALGLLEASTIYAGILGLATGLAGWISAFPRKWVSILGTVTGALTLIISLVVTFLLKLR